MAAPNQIDPGRDHGVVVVVERIPEGRRKKHGALRSSLVVVVHDLREPLVVEDTVDVLRFRLRGQIKIAVVVMTDVLLVQPRDAAG